MRAADLRKSILQAAVQGKLVPQDQNDEPASELLKRIQAEKVALIKEGKLKKEKPLPPITEDEIPYHLPEGWAWCRLYEIVYDIFTGPFGSMLHKSDYISEGIPLVNPMNMVNQRIVPSTKMLVSEETRKRLNSYILSTNDIVVARRGELGRCAIVGEQENGWLCGTGSFFIKLPQAVYPRYFTMLFQSEQTVSQLCLNSVGTTMNNLNHQILKSVLVSFPPFAEQQRIVAKVDELMALCDNLEATERELDALENRFAENLPKSILQAAVQGKLVPQDKNDEPASELLKRIQAEKTALIKEGKLKKEKPLPPPITEDELPYDLPEGWIWCRLGEIIQLLSGRDLEPNAYNDTGKGIPYITGASSLVGNQIDIVRWTEKPVVISERGDILLSCKGTVGKIVLNRIGSCHIARQIMAIRAPFPNILNIDYLLITLQTLVPKWKDQAQSMIPGISRENVLSIPCPLPPLAEQQRIFAKVDELTALCEELKCVDDQPIVCRNVLKLNAKVRSNDIEPIQMAAQGKVAAQPSKQHAAALNDLLEMMDDD